MSFEPFFLKRSSHRLFSVYTPPSKAIPAKGCMLFIHPFAEEMNRSRRMSALLAQALSQAGWGVLRVDLLGCGDSSGDFADADWSAWLADIRAALDWLHQRGDGKITLVGLRLGATLAVQTARDAPAMIDRLALWQPVISGKTMLTQFLRIRVAAAMTAGESGAGGPVSTQSLRDRLNAGKTVEIAGYEIPPRLARALDALELGAGPPPAAIPVHWLELSAEPGRPVSPGASRVIEAWQDAGCAVAAETIVGEPFWNLQETTLAPALIARMTEIMEAAGS
jgi:exosortase A-associated hydrolase 2